MNGRRVLVTGGGRGIGAAIARALAAPGGTVFVNFRSDEASAAATAAKVAGAGARAVLARADVSVPAEVEALFGAVRREAGGLDILVLNAGTPFRYERIAKLASEDFEAQWRGQAFASFLCLRQALPLFPKSGGEVVFILSASAQGMPPGYMSGYVSAKYALLGLAKALESETKGLRVHCLFPGMAETDFIKGFPRPVVDAAREAQGGSLTTPDSVAAEVLKAVSFGAAP